MPLKTPFSSPSKKPDAKAKGKSSKPAPGKNKEKTPPKKGKASPHHPPGSVSVSWWDSLSAERKLDVVGAIGCAGHIDDPHLISAQRSEVTEHWQNNDANARLGCICLPIGLIAIGLRLIPSY
jgi:hypothetical protein